MTSNIDGMTVSPTDTKLPLRQLTCARCGTAFECGTGGSAGGCWCMDETARMPMPAAADQDCLCPACFRAAAAPVAGSPA